MMVKCEANGARGTSQTAAVTDTLHLAHAIRSTILEAATRAYEDAGIQGLCTEGRWEAAVSAIQQLDLESLLTSPTKMTRSTDRTHPNRAAFPTGLSGPALRALDTAGIRSLKDLERWTEKNLAALHGMGPKGVRILRDALHASSRDFKQP